MYVQSWHHHTQSGAILLFPIFLSPFGDNGTTKDQMMKRWRWSFEYTLYSGSQCDFLVTNTRPVVAVVIVASVTVKCNKKSRHWSYEPTNVQPGAFQVCILCIKSFRPCCRCSRCLRCRLMLVSTFYHVTVCHVVVIVDRSPLSRCLCSSFTTSSWILYRGSCSRKGNAFSCAMTKIFLGWIWRTVWFKSTLNPLVTIRLYAHIQQHMASNQ